MDSQPALLPCPWCGAIPAASHFDHLIWNEDGDWAAIPCEKCGAVGPPMELVMSEDESFEVTANAWNRRVPAPQPPQDRPQPDWDKYPWANYACLCLWSGTSVQFSYDYYEDKPEPDQSSGGYHHKSGKWCHGTPLYPLGDFLDLRATLQQRPSGEGVGA